MFIVLLGMFIFEVIQIMQIMDWIIVDIFEVEYVFGKVGCFISVIDFVLLFMVEMVIILKLEDQWCEGMMWDGLIQEMDVKLKFSGMFNIFWMLIQI